jgi:osmotically-inducible protein OsmY
MHADTAIEREILARLAWDPRIDHGAVQVALSEGAVTLTGHVRSYPRRQAVERIAREASGREVVNHLAVRLPPGAACGDAAMADAADYALRWDGRFAVDRIRVSVSDGCITLEGEVDRPRDRAAAERAVQRVMGLRRIVNRIAVAEGAGMALVRRCDHAVSARSRYDMVRRGEAALPA